MEKGVHHARMRMGCSKLHSDLCFKLHVIENPSCTCGYPDESVYHFLFDCPNYQEFRVKTFDSIPADINITLQVLLYGDINMGYEQNIAVFKAVQLYIEQTRRFV